MNSISVTHLSEHPLRGCLYDANNNFKPFPILTIDGVPLNQWIDKNTYIMQDVINLVPAQGWLYDTDNELALTNAWKLLKPEYHEYAKPHAITTVLPILICPDDLDLTCSVIMVEQVITETEVKWLRFGRAWGQTQDVVTSVIWEEPRLAPTLTFDFTQFEQAYDRLKEFDKIWNEPNN